MIGFCDNLPCYQVVQCCIMALDLGWDRDITGLGIEDWKCRFATLVDELCFDVCAST